MSFGWTLSMPCNKVLYEGAGPIDGPFDVASSRRSEIGGYVAPLLLRTTPAQLWGIQHRRKVEGVCNTSKAELSNVRKSTSTSTQPKQHQLNNADLLSQICAHTKRPHGLIRQKWIKGYQFSRTSTSGTQDKNIVRHN
jgi:hypothetical protein